MDPITNISQLKAAIDTYFTTPRVPRVTGAETNVILRAMVQLLTGAGDNPDAQVINNYLSTLPGYGPSRVLLSDFTWGSFDQTANQLAAPAAFTFGPPGTTSVNVSWSAVTNAADYILQQDTSDQFTAPDTLYAGAGTTFPATGLSPGVTYYFRVKAIAAGYQDSAYLTGSVTTAQPALGQVANINLGNTGNVAVETGWVNFLFDDLTNSTNGWSGGTSPVIDNIAGIPSGWKIKFESSGEGFGSGPVTLHGISAPGFPDDVTAYKWYNVQTNVYYQMDMTISGLTPGYVYKIITVHYDNASLEINLQWANYSLDGDQGADGGTRPQVFTSNNIPAAGDGTILGQLFPEATGQVVINGIIIIEIPVTTKYACMVVNSYGGLVYNGWNSLSALDLGTPTALLAINGAATGWSMLVASGQDISYGNFDNTISNADFPVEVCSRQWYGDTDGSFSMTMSGFDNSKTYTLKTCHGDVGGDGAWTVEVNCNGSAAQSGSPRNNTFFLEFDAVVPDSSGDITLTISSANGNPLINALIIEEN